MFLQPLGQAGPQTVRDSTADVRSDSPQVKGRMAVPPAVPTLLLLVAVLLGGCAAPVMLGEPLAVPAGQGGYRFDTAAPTRHRDDLLLVLTFSGGGTRAAALQCWRSAVFGDRLLAR